MTTKNIQINVSGKFKLLHFRKYLLNEIMKDIVRDLCHAQTQRLRDIQTGDLILTSTFP